MVSVPLSRHLILAPLTLASLGLAPPPEGDAPKLKLWFLGGPKAPHVLISSSGKRDYGTPASRAVENP